MVSGLSVDHHHGEPGDVEPHRHHVRGQYGVDASLGAPGFAETFEGVGDLFGRVAAPELAHPRLAKAAAQLPGDPVARSRRVLRRILADRGPAFLFVLADQPLAEFADIGLERVAALGDPAQGSVVDDARPPCLK